MEKRSKLNEKLLEVTKKFPDYISSYPGYPANSMVIPKTIQFYYRSRENMTSTFLHDRYILIYLLDGRVSFEVEEHVFTLESGQMLLIFPHCAHRTVPIKGENNHILQIAFSLRDGVPRDWYVFKNTVLTADAKARRMLLHMAEDFSANASLQKHRLNTLTYRLGEFLELLRFRNTPESEDLPKGDNLERIVRKNEIMQRIAAYCADRLSRKISIKELAEHLQFSPSNLRLFFRKHTGGSLGTYLRNRRLIRGTSLLRSSSLSIKEIAAECGYDSAASFCRAYKREAGISPTEIRAAEQSR